PRFVRSVRESRLEPGPGGARRLRQEAVGSAFLVRRRVRVLLELDETPERRIRFRDVLGRDLSQYAGEWRSTPDSDVVRIDCELAADPGPAGPRVLCRGAPPRRARPARAGARGDAAPRSARRALTPLPARGRARASERAASRRARPRAAPAAGRGRSPGGTCGSGSDPSSRSPGGSPRRARMASRAGSGGE